MLYLIPPPLRLVTNLENCQSLALLAQGCATELFDADACLLVWLTLFG
jgi:hypothetical protein